MTSVWALATLWLGLALIASLLSHGIIDQSQYSILVAAVIGSAVIPTLIANAFFLPRHLLPKKNAEGVPAESGSMPVGQAAQGAE